MTTWRMHIVDVDQTFGCFLLQTLTDEGIPIPGQEFRFQHKENAIAHAEALAKSGRRSNVYQYVALALGVA